ncbi:MAG: T9SS type A sorting domain-containing protein [Bacteroidetes bacterium]|nr:T9SS type A sorting domain-containing protein [Bacteroidota bacterium]
MPLIFIPSLTFYTPPEIDAVGYFEGFSKIILSQDSNLFMLGKVVLDTIVPGQPIGEAYIAVLKVDKNGDIIWQYNSGEGAWDDIDKEEIRATSDGGAIISASTYFSSASTGYLIKIDSNGQKDWEHYYGLGQYNQFQGVVALEDGFCAAGRTRENLASPLKVYLVKTDLNGNIEQNNIFGRVYFDFNEDCTPDSTESGQSGWIVELIGDEHRYTLTDSLGLFSMYADSGSYLIKIHNSGYWQPCLSSYIVNVNSTTDTIELEIPVQAPVACPLMEVSMSTPIIRLCSEVNYFVHYCNNGTLAANDVIVQVELDPQMQYVSATVPLISQTGQALLFDIGQVEIDECSSFQITANIDCDSSLMGQTICSVAHIFPDTICNNTWTGANLEISGTCEGDSVHFTITNTGGNMPQPYEYIVIEDNIILFSGELDLLANQSFTSSVEAANGATYHLLAAQDPNLPPLFGNAFASASVEGCVGPVNPGVFNQFPQDDGEPWLDIDCHEVVASFDPNDKSAEPTGWQDEHFIDNRTALDYLIRFQNTGTDTAFRVVLIDTLSSFLDPATIRPGAASHPYLFELSGQGIAKFIFENILLPDSTTNEAASHGFVQFHISQKPDNQPGTVVENTAGIYFDYNAPVYTNTTFHTVHEPWVQVVSGSVETFGKGMQVKISPNPMGEWAIIELEDQQPGENTLVIIDGVGREVLRQAFAQNKVMVQRSGLVSGIYFFRIENGDKLTVSGKLIVR